MADDIAENSPWGTYTAVDDAIWTQRGWQIFASSGTTARPRVFRYTSFDRSLWTWANARAMWAMGFRPGRDSALLAFGYGPHVWLWGVHYALNLMNIPIVTAGGLDSRARARFVHEYRPTILACTPSYALYLGNLMSDLDLDPAASAVRYLFCAGEPGFSIPATRRRLEELWQAELHEFYGCTEAAPAAGGYTCAAVARGKDGPASTHLMEDTAIWETVDPVSFRPVPPGERGLSVVTNLCSESSPQLRFLVGDFTTLTHARCDCGRTHLRALGGFLGRADDMLNVRGVTVFPSAIEDAVRRVAEIGEEFQMVISREKELDVLTVLVEPRPEISAERHPAVAKKVETEIVSRCELRPVIQLLPYGTLRKRSSRPSASRTRAHDRRDAAMTAGADGTFTEEFVDAAGVRVQLRHGGTGTPLLILHSELGVPGWLRAHAQLAQHFSVYVPSLPGFGRSARPDWLVSVRDLAAWVTWFIRDLKLPQPLPVIGFSLGGWIAAEIATVNASIFSKIVLVGTAGLQPEDGQVWDYFVHSSREALAQAFFDPAQVPEYAQYYGKAWTPEEETQAEQNREMAARLFWKPYMRSHTLAGLLPGVATPTLVVWGREDAIIPLNAGQRYLRAIPGATAKVLDRCGHLPEMEQPEAFVQVVLDFLAPRA